MNLDACAERLSERAGREQTGERARTKRGESRGRSVHTEVLFQPQQRSPAMSKGSFEPQRAVSSAGEHVVHTDGVSGSIPLPPTIFQETTTHRGDIAELMAAVELLRRGYRVARPLSNGTAYDLIVDDGRVLKRVQVKRATTVPGGLRASLSTSKYHRKRSRVLYEGKCDAVIVVDCDRSRFFVFFGKDLQSSELRLRTASTKNNQQAGIRHADQYELSRAFPRLVDGAGD